MSKREIAVAELSEINDGEMKEMSAGETKILLARVDGTCYALGANCTHYGAPLVDGVLSGDRIVCPWHHACFNARTGDMEEPPALDSLPGFDLRIENGKILVSLPEDVTDRRTPKITNREPQDDRLFIILGGGAAGYMAAQTLREDGFTGRVLIITREDRAPYDRPNLSKDYLQGHAEPEWMPLRGEEFFAEYDIELMLGSEVVSVDAGQKTVKFSDGQKLTYDSLLVATGGVPRKLPFQSDDQENVFLLRSFTDSDAIIAAAGKGKHAVVIGASFIGMEAASSLKIRGCEVTVVAPDEVPFVNILGREIGELFQHIHEQNGVKFKLGTQVKSFAGRGRVEEVVLENGERLRADLVVVGIGVKPATDFLDGVTLHKDGGVIADKYLSIGDALYAAGDIAHFPDARTGEHTRIEHWRTALQQGRVAAHNMAGRPTPFDSVPFFWTTQFDATLNYVGHAKEWDRIVIQGDVRQQDFLAFYVKAGRILAVAGMNRDREIDLWEERMRLDQMPSPDQLP
jgi:NADPH-dependent 2,4-dienoyl-CoA reductase/sulfur reductase-like enzyme/nitrite reductase/ring-hydroxylating ferredoxin subunit